VKIRVIIVESVNVTGRSTGVTATAEIYRKINFTNADGEENESQFTPRRIVRSACCAPSL
jgi:hypothetical protein